MFTIFSNPRPFEGEFDYIQRNSILSWKKLRPACEIILFEDEDGTTSKVAKELGVRCETQIKHDEFGTPLFNDVLEKVQRLAKNETVIQVNSDIILLDDFYAGILLVKDLMKNSPFFITGRRWNLDIAGPISFNEPNWESRLRDRVKKEGKLHGFSGMDYWLFLRDFKLSPPAFVVGRPGIDSWLIYKMRSLKVPVIDATKKISVVHQNHSYPKKKDYFFGIEKQKNIKSAGGFSKMATLREADWILTQNGLEKPPYPRRIFSQLLLFYPWRLILALKRRLLYILREVNQII